MSKPRFKTVQTYKAFNIIPNSGEFDWVGYVESGEFEKFVNNHEAEGYRFVTNVYNDGFHTLFERVDNES